MLDADLQLLSPREREVIKLLFGLRDGIQRTTSEVAKVYGVRTDNA